MNHCNKDSCTLAFFCSTLSCQEWMNDGASASVSYKIPVSLICSLQDKATKYLNKAEMRKKDAYYKCIKVQVPIAHHKAFFIH